MDNEELKKEVFSLRKDVESLKVKVNNIGDTIKYAINEALASQFEKVVEKIDDSITQQFNKRRLEELEKKEHEEQEKERAEEAEKASVKKDLKMTVLKWLLLGFLGAVVTAAVTSIPMIFESKYKNQKVVTENYYKEIVQLRKELDQKNKESGE